MPVVWLHTARAVFITVVLRSRVGPAALAMALTGISALGLTGCVTSETPADGQAPAGEARPAQEQPTPGAGAAAGSDALPTPVDADVDVDAVGEAMEPPGATPTADAIEVLSGSLVPEAPSVARGATIDVAVHVVPAGTGVSAGDATVTVPSAFEIVDIHLGDLLGAAVITGLRVLGDERGLARLAVARIGPTHEPTEPGNLMLVELRVRADAPLGLHDLGLDLQLTDAGFGVTYLQATASVTVTAG